VDGSPVVSILTDKIGGLALTIIAASISAYLSVKFAFRRFYNEKEWERKADAYSKIFVAVHHLREHTTHELNLVVDANKLPKGEEAEAKRRTVMERLTEDMVNGLGELHLQIDIGTFTISEGAVALLQRLVANLDECIEVWRRESSLQAHFECKLRVIDQSLEELRKIAKKDLAGSWN
jgi:hypothetical protein